MRQMPNGSDQGLSKKSIYLISLNIYFTKISARLTSYGCTATYKRIFAYKTPTPGLESAALYLGLRLQLFPEFISHLSERFGWNATPQPAKRRRKSRDRAKIPCCGDHRRIGSLTLARPWMLAARQTRRLSSEIAVAHTQSIRHAFEKSTGDGSFDKSLSAS